MINNFFINSKFIANVPKSSKLGQKQEPQESTGPSRKTSEDGMELWKIPWAPITIQNLSNGAPSEFSQRARKEDVPSIFFSSAERTVSRGRTMSCRNLLTGRESI
jgi:hypothetical protein